MNIIHSIFSLILKFRAQLIAQPWDSQQGEAVHPSFIAMQQSYNTFKYYSHFLFKGKDICLIYLICLIHFSSLRSDHRVTDLPNRVKWF